jgi:hypothetical protein
VSFIRDIVQIVSHGVIKSGVTEEFLTLLCYPVPPTVMLTLSLIMSYIYMELLVKPEILSSYIYGPTFGNAQSRLFLYAALLLGYGLNN